MYTDLRDRLVVILCWLLFVVCPSKLGVEDGSIFDSQLTASSVYDSNHGPERARLNGVKSGNLTGAWSAAANSSDEQQWIRVDFDWALKTVSGIITQGRQDYAQWVTEYMVQYISNGAKWEYVQDGDGLNAVSVDEILQTGSLLRGAWAALTFDFN